MLQNLSLLFVKSVFLPFEYVYAKKTSLPVQQERSQKTVRSPETGEITSGSTTQNQDLPSPPKLLHPPRKALRSD